MVATRSALRQVRRASTRGAAGERPQPPCPCIRKIDPGPGKQRAHLSRAAQVDVVSGWSMAKHLGVALSALVRHLYGRARARATIRATIPSATARSIGSPPADSSAQSSSAVDSERAKAPALGRSPSSAKLAC